MTSQSHETLASFRKISSSSNRKFGLTIGAILCALSLVPLLHHQPVRLWLLGLGAVVFVAGALVPALLAPANQLWFRFGLLLGRITNPVVMGVLFFCVIVPFGWVLRRSGKDLLRLKHDAAAASYWIARDPAAASSLQKQF